MLLLLLLLLFPCICLRFGSVPVHIRFPDRSSCVPVFYYYSISLCRCKALKCFCHPVFLLLFEEGQPLQEEQPQLQLPLFFLLIIVLTAPRRTRSRTAARIKSQIFIISSLRFLNSISRSLSSGLYLLTRFLNSFFSPAPG